jgi:hypothetical protein
MPVSGPSFFGFSRLFAGPAFPTSFGSRFCGDRSGRCFFALFTIGGINSRFVFTPAPIRKSQDASPLVNSRQGRSERHSLSSPAVHGRPAEFEALVGKHGFQDNRWIQTPE